MVLAVWRAKSNWAMTWRRDAREGARVESGRRKRLSLHRRWACKNRGVSGRECGVRREEVLSDKAKQAKPGLKLTQPSPGPRTTRQAGTRVLCSESTSRTEVDQEGVHAMGRGCRVRVRVVGLVGMALSLDAGGPQGMFAWKQDRTGQGRTGKTQPHAPKWSVLLAQRPGLAEESERDGGWRMADGGAALSKTRSRISGQLLGLVVPVVVPVPVPVVAIALIPVAPKASWTAPKTPCETRTSS